MMLRLRILCAILVACFAGSASADVMFVGDAVLLSELEAGDTMTVGDKTFSDFSYLATGDMPISSDINVQGIIDCDGNYGIRLQGGFVDLPGGGASDALVNFNVSVTPGAGMQISDAHLAANLDVVGNGLALVTETFLPIFNNLDMTIFNNGIEQLLTDWVKFDAPVDSLPVQKDILLLSAEDGGIAAAFSFIDQTFSQVPEPSCLGILWIALAGLMFRRKQG